MKSHVRALVYADRLAEKAIEFDAALRAMRQSSPGAALPAVRRAAEAFGAALRDYEERRGREWVPPEDEWIQ